MTILGMVVMPLSSALVMAISNVPLSSSAALPNFSLTANVGNVSGGRRDLASASTCNLSNNIRAARVSGSNALVAIFFPKNLMTPFRLRSDCSSASHVSQISAEKCLSFVLSLISFSDKREIGRLQSALAEEAFKREDSVLVVSVIADGFLLDDEVILLDDEVILLDDEVSSFRANG